MDPNIEMLNYIHKNAEMGQNSINHLLKVINEDSKFRTLLERQFKEYKNIFDTSEQVLNKFGYEAKETGALQKFEVYMMIDVKTINNKSSDHVSEMLIQGSTMGIIQITRRLKEFEGHLNNEVSDLAKKLLATEKHNIEDCREFLGKPNEFATV